MFSKREYSQNDSGGVKKTGLLPVEKLILVVPLLALLGFSAWQFQGALRDFFANAPTSLTQIARGEKPAHVFPAPGRDVRGVTFSPDDSLVAISSNDSLAVWDIATDKKLWQIKLEGSTDSDFLFAAFSPDGATLAAQVTKNNPYPKPASTRAVAWEAKSGRLIFSRVFTHSSLIFAPFGFSLDSKMLTLPSQPPQWLDAKNGAVTRTFPATKNPSCVTFLSASRYAVTTMLGEFKNDNKAFHFVGPAPGPYANMKVPPLRIEVRDFETDKAIAVLPAASGPISMGLPGGEKFFNFALPACDGKKFFDGQIRLFDLQSAKLLATSPGTSTWGEFSKGGQTALTLQPRFVPAPTNYASTLAMYDLASGRALWKRDLPFSQGSISLLADGERGAMIRLVQDKTPPTAHREIEVFSLQDGKAQRNITIEGGSYMDAPPLSPAGKWLFAPTFRSVSLWSAS